MNESSSLGSINASIRECVENFDRALCLATNSQGVEEVHDLRVSVRRLREAFKLAGLSRTGKMRKRLKELMRHSGEVRNCDIALQHFGANFKPLRDRLQEERVRLAEALSTFLKLNAKTLRKIQPLVIEAQPREVEARIAELALSFHQAARKATRQADLDQLHKARIESKKLRYSIELAKPAESAGADEWLDRFRKIQNRLGEINDLRTIIDAIPSTARYKKARAKIVDDQMRKIEEFRKLWKQEIPSSRKRFSNQMLEAASQPKMD